MEIKIREILEIGYLAHVGFIKTPKSSCAALGHKINSN